MNKKFPLLAAILLTGFLLRFTASWFGLPHLYHADEPIVVNHALAYGTGDLNPHFFKIPPLISYLLFILYGIFYTAGHLAGMFQNPQALEFLFYSDPSAFYLLARFVFGVMAGTLTVFALYRLIARHFSSRTALMASALLAVNFLHVRDSHYVYADIPLLLVMVSAFILFFRVQENPGPAVHGWCGAMIGLAAGVKYNGIALAIPYGILLLGSRPKGWLWNGFLAAGAAAIVFILLNPFSVLDFDFFRKELAAQANANQGVFSKGSFSGAHHLLYSLGGGMGLLSLFLGLFGMGRAFAVRDLKRMSIAAFIVAYYGILLLAGQPYDRYVLPLIPFLLFFAADAITWIAGRKQPVIRLCAGLCFFLSFVPNLAKAILFDRLMLAGDTRTQAREWILKNIPSETPLAVDWIFYAPRLPFSRQQLEDKQKTAAQAPGVFSNAQTRKLDFLLSRPQNPEYPLFFLTEDLQETRFLFASPVLGYDWGQLQAAGIQYVVWIGMPHPQASRRFYEELVLNSTKVAEFTPYKDKFRVEPYDLLPLTGGPFLWKEILERERNGQTIQIYKLS